MRKLCENKFDDCANSNSFFIFSWIKIQKMLFKFCLAFLVTLASAAFNEHQYRSQWDMENDHRDPPSVIYVLPDSEFNKYQTKNVNQICANIFLG